MNIVTLIHSFRDAVHDNATLSAWCTTNYGVAHNVHVGIDTRKPPAIGTPLVHLFPLGGQDGENGETCTIGVSCGIAEESLLTTAKTRVIELEGIGNLDAFRGYVKAAILAATLSTGEWFGDVTCKYETVDYFPYFLADMDIPVHYRQRRIRAAY